MSDLRKTNTDLIYVKIAELLAHARNTDVQTVNKTMVRTYFEIGRMIVKRNKEEILGLNMGNKY